MDTAQEIAQGIIQLLEKRGQMAILPEIVAALSEVQAKKSKQNVAVVRTAVSLTDSERDLLKKQLSSMFGRTLQLEEHVDETIIGGMYIQVGDTVIDYTTKSTIETIRQQLEK